MAVTDDDEYAKRLRLLKNFGMINENGQIKFVDNGSNFKISDILAAIGLKQMDKIDAIINKRIKMAEYYNELFAKVDSIEPPEKKKNAKHVYQTYAVYIKKEGIRDKIITYLKNRNIETQIGTYALHLQPSYAKIKKNGKLEKSEKLYRNLLTLPMCHTMTKRDQEHIVNEIKNFLKKIG